MNLRSGILAGSSLQEKKYTHLFFIYFYFFRRPLIILRWDKQGISIRMLDRYKIRERDPGGILTPRKEIYSLIFNFYVFFRRQKVISSYIGISRVSVSEYLIDMRLESGRLAGSSLQEKKYTHLFLFIYLFLRRPLVILH